MQEKLHPFQITVLIYMIQSGVTIFSLPRITADAFGTNGWIGILIVSLYSMINILFIAMVFHYGDGRSIFKIFEDMLPKILLRPFFLCLALLWCILGILIGKDFALLFQMLYLPDLSPSVYILIMLIFVFMLVSKGIYQIGKTTIIFFFMTIWTIFLMLYFISEFEFDRLTPFIFKGDKQLFTQGLEVINAFLGYEIVILMFPYIAKSKSSIKAFFYGNLITTFIIYLPLCFICFGVLSFDQLKNETFPVLTLFEYFQFPFIERIESFVFSLFSLKVLITVVMFYWASDEVFRYAVPKIKSSKISILILIMISFLISLIPDYLLDVEAWLNWLGRAEAVIALGLPLSLLFILAITKIKRKRKMS
ncbi:GerAB/ArcD/ProY family transporter [Chengkuizengella axinellae]|uniref:GerAB/ArcD/ProY family transporter n=1 Tax=Chengkuizengella axinellae TaxID=3064388 RepID=A0ABT9J578_9BACL|nr:GerAB/ArcD/ProY family transporter [Chengkuizengella sp. 2205SS18-9]MDP5276766.1 GerAB/ArcD/ProY family transporter [Chengkuizengella sp. 2205SS18-9]